MRAKHPCDPVWNGGVFWIIAIPKGWKCVFMSCGSNQEFRDRLVTRLFLNSLNAAADMFQHPGESREALGNPFDILIYYPAS